MTQNNILVVRGGGDLASGVIHRLYRCGYRVLILKAPDPARSAGRCLSARLFMTERHLWRRFKPQDPGCG